MDQGKSSMCTGACTLCALCILYAAQPAVSVHAAALHRSRCLVRLLGRVWRLENWQASSRACRRYGAVGRARVSSSAQLFDLNVRSGGYWRLHVDAIFGASRRSSTWSTDTIVLRLRSTSHRSPTDKTLLGMRSCAAASSLNQSILAQSKCPNRMRR